MTDKLLEEKEIFNRARQIAAPEERLAYLQEACGDHPAAMHRLVELLRVYEEERSPRQDLPTPGAIRRSDCRLLQGLRASPEQRLHPEQPGLALANHPNLKVRDPGRAVDLAKKAVELLPNVGTLWNTLGVAHFRAGDWKAAITALEKSIELHGEDNGVPKGGECSDWLVMAISGGTNREWGRGCPRRSAVWRLASAKPIAPTGGEFPAGSARYGANRCNPCLLRRACVTRWPRPPSTAHLLGLKHNAHSAAADLAGDLVRGCVSKALA